MKTMILVAMSLASSLAFGMKNDMLICFNQDISKGYFHYVFPNGVFQVGTKITITDYAEDYKKINAVVTSLDDYKIVIDSKASNFRLVIDQNRPVKPGYGMGDLAWMSYVSHRGSTSYPIICNTSGEPVLE